jgi:hypothetical protein
VLWFVVLCMHGGRTGRLIHSVATRDASFDASSAPSFLACSSARPVLGMVCVTDAGNGACGEKERLTDARDGDVVVTIRNFGGGQCRALSLCLSSLVPFPSTTDHSPRAIAAADRPTARLERHPRRAGGRRYRTKAGESR